jgi:hypothetical protein
MLMSLTSFDHQQFCNFKDSLPFLEESECEIQHFSRQCSKNLDHLFLIDCLSFH